MSFKSKFNVNYRILNEKLYIMLIFNFCPVWYFVKKVWEIISTPIVYNQQTTLDVLLRAKTELRKNCLIGGFGFQFHSSMLNVFLQVGVQIQFCVGNANLGSSKASFKWSVQLPTVTKAGFTTCKMVMIEFDGAVEPLVKLKNLTCEPYFHVGIFVQQQKISQKCSVCFA